MLDPERDMPERASCYPAGKASAAQCRRHPGWRHASGWTEVEEYLDAGAAVSDNDGDPIHEIRRTRTGDDVPRDYSITAGGSLRYSHNYWSVLLEDVDLVEPATPEEEAEALASIFNSIK